MRRPHLIITTVALIAIGLSCDRQSTVTTPDKTPARLANGSGPPITFANANARVGSGLMAVSNNYVALGTALHGGVTVRIASGDSNLVRVGPNNAATVGTGYVDIFVPDGQTKAFYSLHGMEGQRGGTSLTASASGFTNGTASVMVAAPVVELQAVPVTIRADGGNAGFYARIGVSSVTNPDLLGGVQPVRAGAAPLAVTIGNSVAAVAQLQLIGGTAAQSQTVYIDAGQSTTPINAPGGVQLDPLAVGSTIITASAAGFNPSAGCTKPVTVTAPGMIVQIVAPRLGSGLMRTGNYVKLGMSNHGGVTVRIASDNPARLKLGPNNMTTPGADYVDIAVPDGQTNAYFSVHGMENDTGSVTLTASAPGFSNRTASVVIAAPALDLQGLPVAMRADSPNANFYVRIGVSSPTDPNALAATQPLRAGAPPLAVTISNSDATAAKLMVAIGGAQGQSMTFYINPGQFTTPQGTTGGAQLDAVAPGATTVTASAAGYNPAAGYSKAVTITSPRLSLVIISTRIGSGLMKGGNYVKLPWGSNVGGVTVHIASSDPARLLIGPNNATTVGADYVDVAVPDGQVYAYFSLHGVENQTGVVTITASAQGFLPAGTPITVAVPVMDMQGIAAKVLDNGPSTRFYTRIGVSSAGNPDVLGNSQLLRAGAAPLAVTISNSNASAAQLAVVGSTVFQSRTVYINAGGSGASGLLFDPLGSGSTTVTASAPGFNPAAGFAQNVLVINHDAERFPIFASGHAGRWSSCQDCHTTSGNNSVFSCKTCHLPDKTNADHALVTTYVYDSPACYACHPRGTR